MPTDESDVMRHRIRELEEQLREIDLELCRLREGRFTEEEFQRLCHNLPSEVGRECFEKGCKDYQDKLFGPKLWPERDD